MSLLSLFWNLILIIAATYVGISFLRRSFKEFKRRKELREFLYSIVPKKIFIDREEFEKNPEAYMKKMAREMGYEMPEEIKDDEDKEEDKK